MLRRLKNQGEHHFDRMFDTRSEAWEKVGLAMQTSQRAVKRARRQAAVLLPLLVAVLIVYDARQAIFGKHFAKQWLTEIRLVTVVALLIIGWAVARDIGKAVAPTFFRRMDPATAGTVGFVIRLVTLGITILLAFYVAERVPARSSPDQRSPPWSSASPPSRRSAT